MTFPMANRTYRCIGRTPPPRMAKCYGFPLIQCLFGATASRRATLKYSGALLPLERTKNHPKPHARRAPLTLAITGEIVGERTGDCCVSLSAMLVAFLTIASSTSRFAVAATVSLAAALMSLSLEKEENVTARSSNERVSIGSEDETAILLCKGVSVSGLGEERRRKHAEHTRQGDGQTGGVTLLSALDPGAEGTSRVI